MQRERHRGRVIDTETQPKPIIEQDKDTAREAKTEPVLATDSKRQTAADSHMAQRCPL